MLIKLFVKKLNYWKKGVGLFFLFALSLTSTIAQAEQITDPSSEESIVEGIEMHCITHRHIYNDSDCEWTIWFVGDEGNGRFLSGPCAGTTETPCKIPPHSTTEIGYTSTSATKTGTVYIIDSQGKQKSFYYANDNACKDSPSINHDGKTGGAALNNTTDGDIRLWRCNW